MTKTVFDLSWSHSALSQFLTCPQQFYRVRVTKEYPFTETEAIRDGNRIHLELENYIMGRTKALPASLAQYQAMADEAKVMPGVEAEKELALTKDLKHCAWFSRKEPVWARCKIDILTWPEPDTHAVVWDWKTGKYWGPDMQPERTALFLFWYYPKLQKVDTVWYYMKPSPDPKRASFTRADMPRLAGEVFQGLHKMAQAYNTGMWPTTPGSGCTFCDVVACQHRGKRR